MDQSRPVTFNCFYLQVYYDVDNQKEDDEQNSDKKSTSKKAETSTEKANDIPVPVAKSCPSLKKKYKPGPKSKTRPKEPVSKKRKVKNFSEDEDNTTDEEKDELPDLSEASGDDSDDDPQMPRKNENYIRKRKPMKLTIEDLERDEIDDDNWKGSRSLVKDASKGVKKTRQMPTRRVASKQTTERPCFSDESDQVIQKLYLSW